MSAKGGSKAEVGKVKSKDAAGEKAAAAAVDLAAPPEEEKTPLPTPLDKILVSDCRNKKEPLFTAYFRDGKRRVDLVLVINDYDMPKIEGIKMKFIENMIQAGLVVELEEGVQWSYRNLIFVKVHAPDKFVEDYGEYFNIRKYFKESHLEFMRPDKFHQILPCFHMSFEREIIKLVRKQYPGPHNYSPIERSTIVYKVLRTLPFGLQQNYVGLESLLESNIVLAAYPLHDGPYFFLEEQNIFDVNGRQMLYHNWVGYKHLFKAQPVHLIREYFGERMAFLFSFYDMYNIMLRVAAVYGIHCYMTGFADYSDGIIIDAACHNMSHDYRKWYHQRKLFTLIKRVYAEDPKSKVTLSVYNYFGRDLWNTDLTTGYFECNSITKSSWGGLMLWQYTYSGFVYDYYFNFTLYTRQFYPTWMYITEHYDDMPICPMCRDFFTCPFRNLTDYCGAAKFKALIDNPYVVPYILAVSVIGIAFYHLYCRRENFAYWLWEVSTDDAMGAVRPKFYMDTGLKPTVCQRIKGFLGAGLMKALLITTFLVVYVLMIIPALIMFKYILVKKTNHWVEEVGLTATNNVVLGSVAMINAFLIIILEKMCEVLSITITEYTPHRSEYTHEPSHVAKLYGFTFVVNFGLYFFFAFIKGALYTFPGDSDRWYLPMGIGMMNCGILSCLDEVFVVFVVSNLTKNCLQATINAINEFIFYRSTDYNRGKWVNENVPCWEKEYSLSPINEDYVTLKYNQIMLQYALCFFFVSICPFAPFIAAAVNMWDIRKMADFLLLRCRRPLLFKTWGLFTWRQVLFAIPYAAIVCNSITFAVHTTTIPIFYHEEFVNNTRFFADFALSFYNISDFGFDIGKGSASDMYAKYRKSGQYCPSFCMFYGYYNRIVESYMYDRVVDNSYTPTTSKFYINWAQAGFVLTCQLFVMVLGFIMHVTMSHTHQDVVDTRAVEDVIRAYPLRRTEHPDKKKVE